VLELVDVHTYYGDTYVLQGITFATQGGVVALLGRNGMGKTTAIRSIIGLTHPRRGMIRFNGEDITRYSPFRIAQLGIGLVPQGRRIFPSLSVKENLNLVARPRASRTPWTLERVYALFPILAERQRVRGTLLSGGEQQMLAIGRSLMSNPDVLLMDEPSEGLAPMMVEQVGQTIQQLKSQGLSILLVEQNLTLALSVSDEVCVIEKGKIVHQSSTGAFDLNNEIKTRYLGIS
jgi:branched-chain amino acid transport system ATP-binding protein